MPYTVIAVSENTNSFGYRGVIAVDPVNAFAFESAWMPGNGNRDILRGEAIDQNDARLFTPLTRQLTRPCQRVCREVRKIAVRASRKK